MWFSFQYFQLRAHMYQARSLIGSDASGLSDPFARVICGEYCKTTQVGSPTWPLEGLAAKKKVSSLQVIDETLSPTWDELLVFEEILVYGRREDIKSHPPTVIIEIYDQDKVTNKQTNRGKQINVVCRIRCPTQPNVQLTHFSQSLKNLAGRATKQPVPTLKWNGLNTKNCSLDLHKTAF